MSLIVKKVKDLSSPTSKYGAYIDFGLPADQHRFFLVNLQDNTIEYSWFTSHGSGSGGSEKAIKFSNVPNSLCSSLGVYKTAETYQSNKFGYALRLDGLSDSNSNARKRAIVLHRAKYVSESFMRRRKYPGRSWGCFTLEPSKADDIIDKLKNGSIILVQQ